MSWMVVRAWGTSAKSKAQMAMHVSLAETKYKTVCKCSSACKIRLAHSGAGATIRALNFRRVEVP